MKILIDADGCPVVDLTVSIAKENNIETIIVKNHSHFIINDYAKVVTVDKSRDSADYYIANNTDEGDIVITQDYGLAAMVISKKAIAINQNGLVINTFNIDKLLSSRYLNQQLRKRQKKYTKFKKRTNDNDIAFAQNFINLILSTRKMNCTP